MVLYRIIIRNVLWFALIFEIFLDKNTNSNTDGEDDVDTAIENLAKGLASQMSADSGKTGFAWEGARDMYSESKAHGDGSISIGDINVTLE